MDPADYVLRAVNTLRGHTLYFPVYETLTFHISAYNNTLFV